MDNVDGNCISSQNKDDDDHDSLVKSRNIYQNQLINTPTEIHATHYNMNHKNRGLALIFNHEKFEFHSTRKGTSIDYLEYVDIQAQIVRTSKLNHSDYDCLLVVVLSHGDHGILYAKDTAYKPETLWSSFTVDKCPTLAGKPKLFFIQACQGDSLDSGVTLVSRIQFDGYPNLDTYAIPLDIQTDFLVVYSTFPGYYSWRNPDRGSWFIQALCAELSENGYVYDLLTILTFVNRRVAIDYESNVPGNDLMDKQKQIPCINSMLRRLVRFNKKF
ncbi:hypothetical protein ILUMI_07628 [Ignelater luminosus]|uniref:Caspase-1 n=1 Tax=Ignelater luminosus TaxID=2038154 RepID=A0A8K0GE81_IGNLU|nr:hypothetical protein ILUMI_07628 [Ignelater luminosus]